MEQTEKSDRRCGDETRLYFREGEIWWVRLGKNIGYEIDGKSWQFTRPVLVLKKYNQYSFLAAPLTTNIKPNLSRTPLGSIAGKASCASLSQLRNIDSKRLVKRVTAVSERVLARVKRHASAVNFG